MSYKPCKLKLLAFLCFFISKYFYIKYNLLIFIKNKQHKQLIIVIYQKYEIVVLTKIYLKTMVKDEQTKGRKDY